MGKCRKLGGTLENMGNWENMGTFGEIWGTGKISDNGKPESIWENIGKYKTPGTDWKIRKNGKIYGNHNICEDIGKYWKLSKCWIKWENMKT